EGSAFGRQAPVLDESATQRALDETRSVTVPPLELDFRRDARIGSGEQANNPWLQELPEPITKLVYDNALLVPEAWAASHGVADGDMVRVGVAGRTIELPAFIEPGQAQGSASVWLGFGRQGSERVARGAGVDVAELRSLAEPHFRPATLELSPG